MIFEEALERRIKASALHDVVGDNVEWGLRIFGLPAITLEIVSDSRRTHFKGPQLRSTGVQLDVWCKTAGQVGAIKETAIAVLAPAITIVGGYWFGRATVANVRSGGEPQQGKAVEAPRREIARASIDIIFIHRG